MAQRQSRAVQEASLKTIAESVGVSPSTVSRTFSRPDLISSATRQRVQAAAERLGYRPNNLARGLATGRTMTLGLVVSDITNPFFPPLVRAVEDRASEREYALLLIDAAENPSREQSMVKHHAGRVDGLVLAAPRSPAAQLRQMADLVPMVLINRRVASVPSILCTTTAGYQDLVEHLYAAGHRRAVYLGGPSRSWADDERRQSLGAAIDRHTDMQLDVLGPFPATYQGGMTAADSVRGAPYTAAIAFDDIMALGMLYRLPELGIRVPDDLVVAGCDNIEPGQVSRPSLSTIASPVVEAARTAVDLLTERIERSEESRVDSVSLAGRLVLRDSTGAARG